MNSSVRFNQDASCFSVAHSRGFQVFNADPLDQWVERDFGTDGGLGLATMLYRTNYLALVGGGDRPRYPANKVIIWDDQKCKAALTVEFLLPVLNVLLSRELIVVVLANRVHIYSFSTPPKHLNTFNTASNPRGIAAMLDDILVIPGLKTGRIQLVSLNGTNCRVSSVIACHKAPIAAIAVNDHHIATASTTGTIVRLWSRAAPGLMEHEFRRGLDKAEIWSLAFSPSSKLAVLSDKATLHVFDPSTGNERHALSGLPMAPQYFKNEWSSTRARLKYSTEGVLGWTSESALIVVWKKEKRWEKYALLGEGKRLVREAWREIPERSL